MTDRTFTDEDIALGPVLGPEYRASQRFAEGVMKGFQDEHLQPLMKIIADEVQDKLWDMVEQTINALLTGKEWAMQRYPYADYSKGEEIRKAVAVHGGDELLMRRITDLETEVAKKEETIQW